MRANPRNYAGPSQRITLEQALELGPEWVVQEKIDGMYVEVRTDDSGCVRSVLSRAGNRVGERVHRLTGEKVFDSAATLIGELEAHTEAGNRAARSRPGGRPMLHVFDIVCAGDYRQRRHVLYSSWAAAMAVRDRGGRDRKGRFAPECERVRPVAQHPISCLEDYYFERLRAGAEGLVLVDATAPLGARRAKLKLKPVFGVDCPVIAVTPKQVQLRHPDGYTFKVGKGGKDPRVGELWEVEHQGTYASGVLRFPSLTKRRDDIYVLPVRTVARRRPAVGGQVVAGPW